jgi:transposase
MRTFYAGLDVGSSVCELVVIDDRGDSVFTRKFDTSQRNLILVIREARKLHSGDLLLTLEEGEMAQWISSLLRPHVTRLLVSDPKRNAWIARDSLKADHFDAQKLAKLLRGGFLNEVYHPQDQDRAEFKRAVQHYHALTSQQATLKVQIKARFRAHGVILQSKSVFTRAGREQGLTLLPQDQGRQMIRQLFGVLDAARDAQKQALQLMVSMGRSFPEVARFANVVGIGPVWSCTFSAYIQTPHRFKTKRKLWRFSRLGITDRQSNGEPLGRRRLDRSGVGMLKQLSYHAFCAAMRGPENDFRRHFQESLRRTNDKTHARLSTQRKILTVLWAMWKNDEEYRPCGAEEKKLLKGDDANGQTLARA